MFIYIQICISLFPIVMLHIVPSLVCSRHKRITRTPTEAVQTMPLDRSTAVCSRLSAAELRLCVEQKRFFRALCFSERNARRELRYMVSVSHRSLFGHDLVPSSAGEGPKPRHRARGQEAHVGSAARKRGYFTPSEQLPLRRAHERAREHI